jgi:acyl dehydratase
MTNVEVGLELPELHVSNVSVEKMKLFTALIRDPNPIHVDADAVRRLGLGDREINPGPVSLAYLMNMLGSWAGGVDRIKSMALRFGANVVAGDDVVARGTVTGITREAGTTLVECEMRLDILPDDRPAMTGTATLELR